MVSASQFDVVGRDEELDRLEAFVSSLEAGPALVIAGEAGIGKTTLWDAGIKLAGRHSRRALSARPAEAEVRLSFTAVGDLLDPVLGEVLPQLPAPQRRALEIALALEEAGEAGPDQRAVSLALLGAVRALAREEPLLLAVDDIQWLDAASAIALEFTARRLRDEPVGFLLARRVDADVLPLSLERSFGEERLVWIRVSPLSLGAIHHLLRERLGTALARPQLRRIYELSAGNPLFALELGRAYARGDARLERGGDLPVSLDRLVRDRLAGLPPETQRVLAVAAASSQPTLALLDQAAEADALALLAPAVETHVAFVEDGRVRFAHPLLASAAYAATDPTDRRRLHRRLAEIAETLEERARHRALAAPGPDPDVAGDLDAAAQHARRRGAPAAAADLSDQAAALTPPAGVDERRERLVTAALFHFESGDTPRARTLLEGVAAELPRGSRRARVLTGLARVRSYGDDLRAAAELFGDAVEEAGDDELTRAIAHEGVAACSFRLRERLADAIRHAQVAEELALAHGDAALAAEASGTRLMAEGILGRATARDTVERANALRGVAPTARVMRTPELFVAVARMWWDELEDARATFQEVCALARDIGDESSVPYVLIFLAQVDCRLGAFGEAAAAAREAQELAVQGGQDWLACYALALHALADSYRGRAEGGAAAELALECAARTASAPAEHFARTALGHLELSRGNPVASYGWLGPLVEWAQRERAEEPGALPCLPDAITALVESGRLAEAKRVFSWYEANAQRLERASALAAAARIRGLLAAAQGHVEDALASLERAVAEHERVPMPLERARTLLALGSALRRTKRKREARERLDEALAIFERLEARAWAGRARAEIARISGRAPSRGELTPAEQRIVELVAAGKTNREVAAALFLSERTVEGHLSHAYAKLGVRSRTELAHRLRT
jgi:DNA-binding CsgD family transcriptional regulator/exonuclease VII small subunit